jgi:hypothetical protein
MPKCFNFKTVVLDEEGERRGSARFRCYVESRQCKAYTTRGHRRCQNNVIMGGPYCYAHTLSKLKLLVKSSDHVGHDGKGVFAHNVFAEQGRVFQPGDVVCDFYGQIKTNAQIKRRYGTLENVPYGFFIHQNLWIDGACLRSIAHIINHAPPSRANVRMSYELRGENQARFYIMAIKNINHGSELLMNWNWRNVRTWRPARQEDHRTYDCKFSNTWDNNSRGL